MSGDDRPTMPPVRLSSEAELARDALTAPLLSRAAALARWSGSGVPVGAGGELLSGELKSAVALLGLDAADDGAALAHEAWNFAVDTGLVDIEETGGADEELALDSAIGTATPGEELELLTKGDPAEVLDLGVMSTASGGDLGVAVVDGAPGPPEAVPH
jgi:hypothetical protein